MATEKDDPKPEEEKDRKLEIRDLNPKKEVNGGAKQPTRIEKRATRPTGEIDFMNWD